MVKGMPDTERAGSFGGPEVLTKSDVHDMLDMRRLCMIGKRKSVYERKWDHERVLSGE